MNEKLLALFAIALTGPAVTVFEGSIDIPDDLSEPA